MENNKDFIPKRRYERERKLKKEAERLLEVKSSELFKAKEQLNTKVEELKESNDALQVVEEELRQSIDELQTIHEELVKQKNKLYHQNKQITDSIRYAKRIQKITLPGDNEIKKIFPDYFLIYKPKDIISGDFYWVSQDKNIKIAGVIDCTGHGVPGAIMSIVGSNILNNAINLLKIRNPANILTYLRDRLIKRLRQEDGKNDDGMDIGICVFDYSNNHKIRMSYAGSKHKLFVISDSELIELKGDKHTIGGIVSVDAIFENQELELNKGDKIYLVSDGFIDQGDFYGKRFGTVAFKKLINDWNLLPFKNQSEKFSSALDSHQNVAIQRDDITLLAFAL